ncbi:MAG: PAS domain S-box protein [Gallionella sp.]|nr:PAS domain S-box protein [Gallionella sp.]
MEVSGVPLRILILEDSPTDAELMERELKKGGIVFILQRVDTWESFVQALEAFRPDIVLSDYHLLGFKGTDALQRVRRDHPDIPVIMVTGALPDVEAVELLHAGAKDYVLKDRLARLPAAVQRVWSAEQGIRARKAAEQALRESEEKFRRITESAQDAIIMMGADSCISFWNAAAERLFGYSAAEALGQELHALIVPAAAHAKFTLAFPHFQESGEGALIGQVTEVIALRKGGEEFSAELSISATRLNDQWNAISIVRDITGRKQADEKILAAQAELQRLLDMANQSRRSLLSVIEDHKRSEAALQLSETRHRLLFESSRDALMTLAPPSWKFTGANQAALNLFGVSSVAEFTTLGPWDVSPELQPDGSPSGEKALEMIATAMREGSHFFEWQKQRLDGPLFVADVLLTRVQLGGVVFLQSTVRDITERKQAEMAIQHANRALTTLSTVNRALVHADSEDELLQSICEAIVRQRGYRMAWVGYKQHDEAQSIKIMAHAGHDEGYLDVARISWAKSERGRGPSGRAIGSGAAQLCQDIASDPLYSPWREAALQRGYASSIALPLGNGEPFGVLNVYAEEVNAFTPGEVDLLEEMAGDLAFGVHSLHVRRERDEALEQSQRHLLRLTDSLEGTVRAIASIVEMRDPYTAGHQARVAGLASAIARQMALPDDQVHAIHLAGMVHDLGKIQIPAEILAKPGKISAIEFDLIRCHPQAGYDILKDIDLPWPIAQMVLQHHERMDGSGYPQGLKGDQIDLGARILSVADVVEAISSHRPYRPALGVDAALNEISQARGTHFDTGVVDACLQLFREQGYVF